MRISLFVWVLLVSYSVFAKAEDFTGWMTKSDLDSYFEILNKADTESSYFDKGHWISAVEGRWNGEETEYRVIIEDSPNRPFKWWWWFGQSQDAFVRKIKKYEKSRTSLVYAQSFLMPDGSARYQGVWLKMIDHQSAPMSKASEWNPDYTLASRLLELSLDKIKKSFLELVPRQERINYALLLSNRLIKKYHEYDKADIYLDIAENELKSQPDNHDAWVSLKMQHVMISQHTDNHKNSIKYGIDALEYLRKTSNENIHQFSYVLKAISYSYYTLGDFRNSARYSLELAQVARNNNNSLIEAQALFHLAESYYRSSMLSESMEAADDAYLLYKAIDNTKGLGHTSKVLGNIYRAQGDSEKARKSYLAAIKYYTQIRDNHGLANCNFNLGGLSRGSGDFGVAILHYEKASFFFMQSGSASGSGMSKMELGRTYIELDETEKAIALYDEARLLLKKTNSLDRLAQLYTYYADYYLDMNSKLNAKQYYLDALNIYKDSRNKKMIQKIERRLNEIG
jgi:tetratricopeptide (TPR) repeat protein